MTDRSDHEQRIKQLEKIVGSLTKDLAATEQRVSRLLKLEDQVNRLGKSLLMAEQKAGKALRRTRS
jgi:hypothetical protein